MELTAKHFMSMPHSIARPEFDYDRYMMWCEGPVSNFGYTSEASCSIDIDTITQDYTGNIIINNEPRSPSVFVRAPVEPSPNAFLCFDVEVIELPLEKEHYLFLSLLKKEGASDCTLMYFSRVIGHDIEDAAVIYANNLDRYVSSKSISVHDSTTLRHKLVPQDSEHRFIGSVLAIYTRTRVTRDV